MGREDKAMLDSNQLLLYTAAIAIGFLLILKACGWLIRLSGISGQVLQVAYIAVELLIALVVYWTFRKTIRLGEKHILTVSRFPLLLSVFGHSLSGALWDESVGRQPEKRVCGGTDRGFPGAISRRLRGIGFQGSFLQQTPKALIWLEKRISDRRDSIVACVRREPFR